MERALAVGASLMALTVIVSFWEYNEYEIIPAFTLQNYVDVFTSPQTVNRFGTTFLFVFLAVSIELVLGLLLALLLDRPGRDIKVATSLLLLPMAVTPVVAALVLRALLNPLYGWVDYYAMAWGLMDRPVEWLSQPLTAWIAVIGLDVWQ
mgnify:CR=1 FL=1